MRTAASCWGSRRGGPGVWSRSRPARWRMSASFRPFPPWRRWRRPSSEHPKSAPTLHVTWTLAGLDVDVTGGGAALGRRTVGRRARPGGSGRAPGRPGATEPGGRNPGDGAPADGGLRTGDGRPAGRRLPAGGAPGRTGYDIARGRGRKRRQEGRGPVLRGRDLHLPPGDDRPGDRRRCVKARHRRPEIRRGFGQGHEGDHGRGARSVSPPDDAL